MVSVGSCAFLCVVFFTIGLIAAAFVFFVLGFGGGFVLGVGTSKWIDQRIANRDKGNCMTDGINDKRPMFPTKGPVLRARPVFIEDRPVCEKCSRSYSDAEPDEVFYRIEHQGLVRRTHCLRSEGWDV